MKVSPLDEVLERFRLDLVATMQGLGLKVPGSITAPGNCREALLAWVRVQDRAVRACPRAVRRSSKLNDDPLREPLQKSLKAVEAEIEQGLDLTHRLTRDFFRAGFNDFLYNAFRIQHLHLGEPAKGRDKTKRHLMAASSDEILLACFSEHTAYLVDVVDHKVFECAELAKDTVRVILRNWPELLDSFRAPFVLESDLTFEDAFQMAHSGFGVLFDVDGEFFTMSQVMDKPARPVKGVPADDADSKCPPPLTRSACTSLDVAMTTDSILNRIVALVRFAHESAAAVTDVLVRAGRTPPSELRLQVTRVDRLIRLSDTANEIDFLCHGSGHSFRVTHDELPEPT